MAKPARGRPASPSRSDRSSSRSFSPSRSRWCSYSGSGSPSSSRSRSRSKSFSSSSHPSRSKSFSSSSHPSRSSSSRSPSPAAPQKSPAEGVKRGRLPPPETKKASPPPRWVQAECRRLGDIDNPEVGELLKTAVRCLKARLVLFKYCAEEVANMRHNALFKRFISALTRGGPGGLPRPIEVHAHDPLRYVNLPKRFTYVEFRSRANAEKAQE